MTTLDERIEAARKLEGYTPGPWYQGSHIPESASVWIGGRAKEGGGAVLPYLAKTMNWPANYSANATLIAAAPDLHRLALDLAAERERLRGLLWYAWHEFNAIRARSGAPLTHDGMTTVAEEWWDQMTEAFEAAIGEDAAKPWPSPEARVALASEPRA